MINDKYVINIFYQFNDYCYVSQIRNQSLLNKIGKAIKMLRESAGLTQEDVYNDTGIHVGRIETATSNLSVSTLDALCRYFKIELNIFFSKI